MMVSLIEERHVLEGFRNCTVMASDIWVIGYSGFIAVFIVPMK